MNTFVLLFRGINVGGHNILPMADVNESCLGTKATGRNLNTVNKLVAMVEPGS